jgi:EAL domain-containing protein (putative c-di-GMP-specific phosphodiesterase class I)
LSEPVLPFHDRLAEFERELGERGALGLLVLDATSLGVIEDEYGGAAYTEVRERIFRVLEEQRGKDFRTGDIVTLDRPRGLRFVFFLERKRRKSVPLSLTDLRAARQRLCTSLVPNLARTTFPYLKGAPRLEVGYGLAIDNPLLGVERIVGRAVSDALKQAVYQRQTDDLVRLERLQDILLRERVITAYQPILRLKEGTVMGFEALSRGPRGSGLEGAEALFSAATHHRLIVELDRLCRERALLSTGRIPSNAKVFINTLPATMRDPRFRGRDLIEFLDKAQVAPNRIVIEITEKLVIDNYTLFRETMSYFTDLGMSFAVDDVGAGYSGLESIARLKPTYLKIDTVLVRDVHESPVNEAMVKAIVAIGHGIGASVIGEGIHTQEEADALRAMGVDFGQGYHLARPDPGPEPS